MSILILDLTKLPISLNCCQRQVGQTNLFLVLGAAKYASTDEVQVNLLSLIWAFYPFFLSPSSCLYALGVGVGLLVFHTGLHVDAMFSIETTLKYLTLFVVPHPVCERFF